MLTRAEKEKVISDLKTDLEKANALFLTNLVGVSANDAVAIRKNVREASGKVVVTRNTLFAKAAKGTVYEEMLSNLKGPNALAFSFEDAAAVAKAINDASKDHEVVGLVEGFLEDKQLSKAEIVQLANLPSKDEMLATLLATFNAPVSAFVRVLNAIKEQKETGEDPVEVAESTAE